MLGLEAVLKRALVIAVLVVIVGLYISPILLKQLGVHKGHRYHELASLASAGAGASILLSLAANYDVKIPLMN